MTTKSNILGAIAAVAAATTVAAYAYAQAGPGMGHGRMGGMGHGMMGEGMTGNAGDPSRTAGGYQGRARHPTRTDECLGRLCQSPDRGFRRASQPSRVRRPGCRSQDGAEGSAGIPREHADATRRIDLHGAHSSRGSACPARRRAEGQGAPHLAGARCRRSRRRHALWHDGRAWRGFRHGTRKGSSRQTVTARKRAAQVLRQVSALRLAPVADASNVVRRTTMKSRNESGPIDRRALLRSSVILGSALALGHRPSFAQVSQPLLKVAARTIEVNKKAATVFRVAGPGGQSGLMAKEGDRFSGALLNASAEALQMHWHGQIDAPFEQDRARPDGGALIPGGTDLHDFPLTPGTHWMHSHSLSEQQLLAAPLVTREKDAGDVQDVVIMLHDFAFRSPQEILAELGGTDAHAGHGSQTARQLGRRHDSRRCRMVGMHHGPGMMHGPGGMHGMQGHGGGHMMGMSHANDVRYDAYLANDRTLDDPELVRSRRVAASVCASSMPAPRQPSSSPRPAWCRAALPSTGRRVGRWKQSSIRSPRASGLISSSRFRRAGGAFPVLAQVEAATHVTGIVLATAGAKIAKLTASAPRPQVAVDLGLGGAAESCATTRRRSVPTSVHDHARRGARLPLDPQWPHPW